MNKKSHCHCVHADGVHFCGKGVHVGCKIRGELFWHALGEHDKKEPCRKCPYFRGRFKRYNRGIRKYERERLWANGEIFRLYSSAPWKGVKPRREKECPFMRGFIKYCGEK